MFTKIAFIATAAAILLGSASAGFAAPQHKPLPEPLYFQHATGEQG